MNYDQYRALLKTLKPIEAQPTLFGLSYPKCILLAAALAVGALALHLI